MSLTNLLSIMLCFILLFFHSNHNITSQIFICCCITHNHNLTQTNNVFMLDTFLSSSKLLNTFTGHTDVVRSIDYSTFDDCQLICSGSNDQTVRVWNFDNNKQIQSFDRHSNYVYCVKFSPYHYHNHRQNVICSSSSDDTIRFWDFKNNKQLQIFNQHSGGVCGIEFSPFSAGRYLCSVSYDNTIRLWDVKTSKSLHIFNGRGYVRSTIVIKVILLV
ncbi:WD-repeat protein [Reticulomyxa filosa]|uniref:WD-repeat protein n=1 Tax=Reticulomyxa filosa TaxID=46433 RepID=X6MXT7_RETFI|nr:WD-repeat protein [Reticulomyxa filosa]|eukprot:ETO18426.1 WD-repeat protein [Reticulomyxa filosa]